MSPVPPWDKKFWDTRTIAAALLGFISWVLWSVAEFLSVWPLPFSVPRVWVLLPDATGFATFLGMFVLLRGRGRQGRR